MKKYPMQTAVGIFVVIGLICIGYMSVKLGKVSLFQSDTYTLYARFTSVQGLRVGSPVDVFGIDAGSVSNMVIDNERQVATVTMLIDNSVKVYNDASATIKSMGLIGDKYIRIDPGGAGSILKSRQTITNTAAEPDIEDLLGRYIFGQANSQQGDGGKEGK